jgi:hypothetical protein
VADLGVAVRSFFLGRSAVTDLVGQRIYTDQLPQRATLPAIVMTQQFTTHEHALSDFAGLAHARVQFECFAATRIVANSVLEALRSSGIVAYKGVMLGVDIRGVRVEEGMSFRDDAATDGSDEQRYVSVMDLVIDYTET